ncbi:STAG-domain-containing protein [Nadsonia fulvescens var. elongata DSM 6958]|uniref:STAG-domain-containing protein n=1 Tax=Nadsonia fulvescens var. elongata DSM 6958 TaxID=857566 RepID=A0A1E3PFG3_9ASCO|nr:STAG-domain-containing protein [Nadsonia fulvescens var. elongata DSM 6958]
MSDSSSEEESSRPRRSQRARKAPSFFQPEVTNTNSVLPRDSDDDSSSSSSEDEVISEDEARPARSKRTRKQATTPAKRTRTKSTSRDILPSDLPGSVMEESENYLYDAMLDPETAIKELAQGWLESYEENRTEAMKDFVNFIFKSCGCEFKIENHDIEDSETAAESLAQVQEAFRDHALATYPLISKKPQFRQFRKHLISFLSSFTRVAAEKGLLYDDENDFMENFQIWISAMSSSNLRPFRHTSVVIFLTILTNLCELYVKAVKLHAQNINSLETEKKKTRKVKEKLQFFEKNILLYTKQSEILKHLMKDIFDTIFIHRYRDVDPRIRSECMHELGKWMDILPEIFFEGQYLRYFGWVLSDTQSSTRLEVVKSLSKLYRQESYIQGFRQFTERFCPRMIEMAQSDSDQSVRVAVIELLITLRQIEFLDDEEIEKVNTLVFDADYRVRKTAAKFLTNHVREVTSEEFQTHVGGNKTDIFKEKTSKLEFPWVAFKILGSILKKIQPTDAATAESRYQNAYQDFFSPTGNLTRLSIAAASIWEVTKEIYAELNDWTSLARQLLYDFSSQPKLSTSKKVTNKQMKNLHKLCTIESDLEVPLLQVLHGLIAASENSPELAALHQNKRKKVELINPKVITNEGVSHEELIRFVPRLLEKYSYDPLATATVLRIHLATDITIYRDLRQEEVYNDLLSKICRQFVNQDNYLVLLQCSECFNYAQKFTQFSDTVKPRLQDLEEEIITSFKENAVISDASDAESRDNFLKSANKLRFLSRSVNITSSMSRLSSENTGSALDLLIKHVLALDDSDSGYGSDPNAELDLAFMTEFTKRKLFVGIEIARMYCTWLSTKLRLKNEELDQVKHIKQKLELLLLRVPVRLIHPEMITPIDTILNDINPADLLTQVGTTLIDLVVTMNVSTSVSEDQKPIFSSDSVKTKLFKIFLLKERHYAYFADLNIEQVGEIQLSREEEELQDEDFDEMQQQQQLQGAQTDLVKKWKAETQMCQYAGKLNLCIMLNILSQEPYGTRLTLNQNILGPLFLGTVSPAQLNLDGENGYATDAGSERPAEPAQFDKTTVVARREIEYISEIENSDEE